MAAFRRRLYVHWREVQAEAPVRDATGPFRVGGSFTVSSRISLGALRPEEVDVELYYGNVGGLTRLSGVDLINMQVAEDLGDGRYLFKSEVSCRTPGRYGFTVRVTPRGDTPVKYAPGLITWA